MKNSGINDVSSDKIINKSDLMGDVRIAGTLRE